MLARAGLKTSRPLSWCCCTDFEAFVALDAETIRNNERHCSAAVPRPLFLFLRRFEVRGTVPFQAPRSHGDDLVEKVRIPDQNHGLDGPSDGGVKHGPVQEPGSDQGHDDRAAADRGSRPRRFPRRCGYTRPCEARRAVPRRFVRGWKRA